MDGLLDNRAIKIIVILVATLVISKVIRIAYNQIKKKKSVGIGFTFLQSAIQAGLVIFCIIEIIGEVLGDKKGAFLANLLQASPFIAVVLGFILQESLSNIIQGIILILFKPFEIGARIRLVNHNISGIVTNINLNNTMIQNLTTSAVTLVPNSVIAKEMIENFHYKDSLHKYYFDIQISFYSDIDKAIELVKKVVSTYSVDGRTEEQRKSGVEEVQVLVQRIDLNGVNLRCPVYTEDIAQNFIAMSNIRHDIIIEFHRENIRVPYSQDIKIINLNQEEKSAWKYSDYYDKDKSQEDVVEIEK